MAAATFFALAYTFVEGGHIRITLFLEKVSKTKNDKETIKKQKKYVKKQKKQENQRNDGDDDSDVTMWTST